MPSKEEIEEALKGLEEALEKVKASEKILVDVDIHLDPNKIDLYDMRVLKKMSDVIEQLGQVKTFAEHYLAKILA